MNFKNYIKPIVFVIITSCLAQKQKPSDVNYTILIHGGAGDIKKKMLTNAQEEAYSQKLEEALKIGEKHLKNGGTAVETVERVIKVLEDSPLFNAGKGAVFNHLGYQEMDASIMNGKTLQCGAVAGVTNLKNPIQGARIVMDSTKHVFLYGKRGQEFCIQKGATYADSAYFYTDKRWGQYQKAVKKNLILLDHSVGKEKKAFKKMGTVGCVVLDAYGNLAAGTSTGGLVNKKHGRIGDSPIIGAGTYANNASCAVSCTGVGEYFIRGTIARDVAAKMEYGKLNLKKSSIKILQKLIQLKGRGGFIAVDKKGNYQMQFTTKGMFRGVANSNGLLEVKMYR